MSDGYTMRSALAELISRFGDITTNGYSGSRSDLAEISRDHT